MPEPISTSALQETLDRFLAGDSEAKKTLIQYSHTRLLKIAHNIRKDASALIQREAETSAILNGAFERISRALEDERPADIRHFFALSAKHIHYTVMDLARKLSGSRRKKTASSSTGGSGISGLQIEGETPLPGHLESETSQIGRAFDVQDALSQLTNEEREVVGLLFLNGLSQSEAAAVLGVNRDKVKDVWARARVKLKEYLKQYGNAKDDSSINATANHDSRHF